MIKMLCPSDCCEDDCCITKDDIGLGNVDNTSDVNKPISNATQKALNQKADSTTVVSIDNRLMVIEAYNFPNVANRLTVVEGKVTTLESDMTIAQGDITTLQGQVSALINDYVSQNNLTSALANYVTLASTQTVSGAKTFNGVTEVPNTTAETKDLQAVNGNRLQDDLDAYASMVRTTGNQVIYGDKRADIATYRGYIATSTDSFYTVLQTLGSVGSAFNIVISCTSRYGACIGIITYDGNTTVTWNGYNVVGNVSIGIGVKSNVAYLCAKRTTPAGTQPSIIIHSIANGSGIRYVTPIDPNSGTSHITMDNYYTAVST